MELIKIFLTALPEVATSPMAFVAYIIVILSWVIIASRINRNRNLLMHLDKLPEADRLEALIIEMGEIKIPDGLSPEQWLRARTHKFLLIGFMVLCAAIVIIFSIASIHTHGKIAVAVSLYKENGESSPQYDTDLVYEYSKNGDLISIRPNLPYQKKALSGQIVPGLDYFYHPFSWSLPSLSIKVSNNSSKTIMVSELVARIKNSKINSEPLLYLSEHNFNGGFILSNDGWGEVISPKLFYP